MPRVKARFISIIDLSRGDNMSTNGLGTNKNPSLPQCQHEATARALELNLMEFITALLCWCERVEAHPNYPALGESKPALAPNISGAVHFARRRRAELMISRSPVGRMEEEVKRLKEMLRFLKNDLWQHLELSPSSDIQNLSSLRLN